MLAETKKLSALLISNNASPCWSLPELLTSVGFSVDMITESTILRYSKYIRECLIATKEIDKLSLIKEKLSNQYDWIIIGDDQILSMIKNSGFSIFSMEDKLKILPIQNPENLTHIASKIGLSQVLHAKNINSPFFYVANNIEEAKIGAKQIGFPVFVKVDESSAGLGVFPCHSIQDITKIPRKIFDKPVLIQKQIIGKELDLSALFIKGKLIHFSYSIIEKVFGKFGPSKLRTYYPLHLVDKKIFTELKQLGEALGADGFVTISCIEEKDTLKRFYIEADMRPTVWVSFSKYFADDLAARVKNWFLSAEAINENIIAKEKMGGGILLPYFLRLNPFELLINRYNVWSFMQTSDKKLRIALLIRHLLVYYLKRIIPLSIMPKLKLILQKIGFS